ncbi:hypothetical protein [Pseudooceanicola onchidii]|uniref:hypothetical protein n=1 Tax=Pseudooceanicola onchidii TaxID=2562279 RepID=UPI001F11674F|nr:hypothetical protein [Pseudooceanicola onchidii]
MVGPRFDFVNLKRLTDETLNTGEAGFATGDYDGMSIEIESHPILLQDDAMTKNGVVLIIRGVD